MRHMLQALLITLFMSCCVVLTTSEQSHASQGDILWSRLLDHSAYRTYGTGILTHSDGTVTTTSCATGDGHRFRSFDLTGDVTSQIGGSPVYPAFCQGQGVAGLDGTSFYTRIVGSGSSMHYAVATMKNGYEIASVSISRVCSSITRYGEPRGMAIGADGNLYLVATNFSNCPKSNVLMSINGQTGQARWTSPVELTVRSSSWTNVTKLGVYSDGLAILEEDITSGGNDILSYYDYSGSKNEALSCAIHDTTDPCGFSSSPSESVSYFFVNEDGTVYIDTARYGSPCYIRRTLRYTTQGMASEIQRPSCNMAMSLLAPNNTIVFTQLNGTSITVTDTSGTVLYQGARDTKPGYVVTQAHPAMLDGDGAVVVPRQARLSSSSDKHVYIDRLNIDGSWTTLFSTEQLADPNMTDTFSLKIANDLPPVGFANNALFVSLCKTACNTGGESTAVIKVGSPGMSVEYPRREIFDEYYADNGESLNYVALGDSFSSGEGVPPFINGTDVSGTNMCHRSSSAYPMLLDQDPNLNLNLQSFRACSGVTTQTLVSGQGNNGNQLSSLNEDTDVVTITIGGNDVGFADFATLCYIGESCDTSTTAYSSVVGLIENVLPGDLVELYGTVASQLGSANTSARVYVIGYPRVIEDRANTCQGGLISLGEQTAASNVVNMLNVAIQDAIEELDDNRFVYVNSNTSGSPFEDHDLCGPETAYFNGLDPQNEEYTAHPNGLGHIAFKNLVANELNN